MTNETLIFGVTSGLQEMSLLLLLLLLLFLLLLFQFGLFYAEPRDAPADTVESHYL